MGISKKFQSLLFKGVVLASLLALLAGAVGTVYAQSSSGASTSSNTDQNASSNEQQESLWIARAQSLVVRVNAILPTLRSNGRDVTRLEAALEDLNNVLLISETNSNANFSTNFVGTAGITRWADSPVLLKSDSERATRAALRGAYNQTKREYDQLRAAFPSDFAGVSNNGLATTGSTSAACGTAATAVPTAVPATGGCAAPVSVPTATPMPTAVPATGSTCGTPATGGTSSSTAAATPVATSVMTATATSVMTATATATVSATATTMPTATSMPTATATTAPAAPATGSSCTCGTPATGAVATATAVPATGSCGAPNTGAMTFTTFDQFQAFVWSNYAASLVARVNAAISAGTVAGVSTSDMQRDLPAVQDLLTVSTGSQTRDWRNSLQSAYWILKHDYNVFRADNPGLISTSTTGVASTGGTSSTTSSTSTCGAAAPTAVPATGSSCTTKP